MCRPLTLNEKMKFGQEKFISFLDRMTKAAADQENCLQYIRFDQVIQFDYKTNILHLPDLWQGEPPMATVNCAYSEKVEKLKMLIMNVAAHNSKLRENRAVCFTPVRFMGSNPPREFCIQF